MGTCKYCGNKAGLFKNEHKECHSKYLSGTYKIPEITFNAIIEQSDFTKLDYDIGEIASHHFIKDDSVIKKYVIRGFNRVVDHYLEDGVLSIEEEDKLTEFLNHYDFNQEDLSEFHTMEKIVKASILRDVTEGKEPTAKINITTPLPILLQKSEYVVWLFNGVQFYEQRSKTTYQGSSQGMSIRVAKGVYYRTGAFKGNPIRTEAMMYITNGSVIITNKHFFFVSSNKNIKVAFTKLLSIDPYDDGIGLQKDGNSTKPQVYKGLDGWFVYNYIMNMNNQ